MEKKGKRDDRTYCIYSFSCITFDCYYSSSMRVYRANIFFVDSVQGVNKMFEFMLGVALFSVLAVFVTVFTHPFMSIALMILWVWVYKECMKHD